MEPVNHNFIATLEGGTFQIEVRPIVYAVKRGKEHVVPAFLLYDNVTNDENGIMVGTEYIGVFHYNFKTAKYKFEGGGLSPVQMIKLSAIIREWAAKLSNVVFNKTHRV